MCRNSMANVCFKLEKSQAASSKPTVEVAAHVLEEMNNGLLSRAASNEIGLVYYERGMTIDYDFIFFLRRELLFFSFVKLLKQ